MVTNGFQFNIQDNTKRAIDLMTDFLNETNRRVKSTVVEEP